MPDQKMPDQKISGADIARSRQDAARKARLAAALKENLQKRKAQARKRAPVVNAAAEQPQPDALLPQSSVPSLD